MFDSASFDTGSISPLSFEFGVIATETQSVGGYVPPKILKGTLRRKDEEILEQIYRLIETAEEVQAPKIKAKAQKVETRAKTYLNTETPDLTPLIKSIQRIEKEIQIHIQEMQDEDNAIQALLSII